ncbi:MAG: BLUF domain-containing protein [Allosphingosinicella sp.]|uniref:BLUF domain-containing protein n=1 Tax=Allosphingosinicella sp. TaxID=2823234 RepID=UPI0039355AE7
MQLKTLTYTSRARLDLTSQDLIDIHETARHFNALDGISGLLIFNGVHFLQIIEGSEAAIDSLLARLRMDDRHSAIEVRDERLIEERSFPDWSMELCQVTTDSFQASGAVEEVLPDGIAPAVRDRILTMTAGIGEVRLG